MDETKSDKVSQYPGGSMSALALSQVIIKKAKDAGINDVTNLKVIKLAYLCQGWALGAYGRPIFFEPVEAWRYGPVIPSIYNNYKKFGSNPIELENVELGELDASVKDVVDFVIENYGKHSAFTLTDITHLPDTPWSRSIQDQNIVISQQSIKSHYEKLFNEERLA